jgi:hypothetical protein
MKNAPKHFAKKWQNTVMPFFLTMADASENEVVVA